MGKKKRKKRLKKKHIKMLGNKPSEWVDLRKQLIYLKENRRKININQGLYFNKRQNEGDILNYYHSIKTREPDGLDLFYCLTNLLAKTHRNRIPYTISKDLYLYTWVDLYPDGTTKSIYSGEEKDPASLIVQDHETIQKRYKEFTTYLKEINKKEVKAFKELKSIEWKYKFNTEHIVPQSWFNGSEPMKGDLHHLFTCQPECNISRSNYPFADFHFYTPESLDEPISNHCGLTINERFEPEHGKGKAARAMLYFMTRYPAAIKRSFRTEIDLSLLFRWHKEFPVTLYELHRNQTIFAIQGNRNPFIDFPELVDKIHFPSMN